jgi:hypothetical protein
LMRQTYLGEFKEELGLSDMLVKTSFMFFYLNVAVFCAAVMIAYLAHDPEPGFEKAEHDFMKARKTAAKMEAQRIRLLRRIGMTRAATLQKANRLHRDGMHRVNMLYGCYDQILREGQEDEERCLARAQEQIAAYRHENLKCRADKLQPQCFRVSHDFPLKLQTIKEKLNNEEFTLPEKANGSRPTT